MALSLRTTTHKILSRINDSVSVGQISIQGQRSLALSNALSPAAHMKSATHIRFRQAPPDGSKIIELNWRDNPFFPKILNTTRLDDLKNRPDQYDWVWNGGFRTVVEGAYYSKLLLLAKDQKRIEFVPLDPLMQVRAYFDIGGTGARADAFQSGSLNSSGRKSTSWIPTRRKGRSYRFTWP
jgi:hypothetical protein